MKCIVKLYKHGKVIETKVCNTKAEAIKIGKKHKGQRIPIIVRDKLDYSICENKPKK